MTQNQAKVLYTGIEELLTFQGIAQKSGRNITEKDLTRIADGALLIEGDKVLWVGTRAEAQSQGFSAPTVDLKAKTVMPAFIECHTHSVFSGSRFEEFELRLQGTSYAEIAQRGGGILSTVKSTRQTPDHEHLRLLKERIQNFRKQGVSVVEVKSGYGLSTTEELRFLKLVQSLKDDNVLSTFLGPHSASPDFSNLEDYLEDLIQNALPKVKSERLSQRVDIFIESGFFTPAQAHRYFEAAKRLGFQISVHAEQLSWSGGIQKALEFEAKSVDHCVNASEEDISKLASSETTAVLLPSADFYLDIEYPPARRLIDSGARVALSTDFNPGSSPSQSLELCSLLARIKMKMTLPEVFSAWTVGAAHVLGIEENHGSLEVGKCANFSVWNKPWSSFFYNFEEIHPRDLYLSGKRVAYS